MYKIFFITTLTFYLFILNTYAQQKFEVYTGINESFRILSYDKSDTTLNNSIALSVDDSKVRALNGGFRYRILDRKYLSFKVGIEINALGFMDRKITGVRWPSEITPDGYVPDPTLPKEIQTGRKFIYFDIPLALELKKSWSRWTPNIQIELVPQFLVSIKNIYKTEFGTETDFAKPTKYTNRFNLASGVSIGSYYRINEKWSVLLNGYYRRQLFDIVDAPITASLYAFGINAGVSFNL